MKVLENIKWDSVISSTVMIILGCILAIFPGVSLSILATVAGVGAICAGLFSIIRYFTYDLKESFFSNDFLIGIVILTIGVLIIFKPSLFISIIPIVLGIVIMVSGFSKLQDGISAKRLGYGQYTTYLILAIIDVVIGLFVLFNPLETASIIFLIIGIGLIYSGISDLFVTLYLAKKFHAFMSAKDEPAKIKDDTSKDEK